MTNRAIQRLDSAISRLDEQLSRGRPKRFSRAELKAIRQDLADVRYLIEDSSIGKTALQVVNLAMCFSRLVEVAEQWLGHLK